MPEFDPVLSLSISIHSNKGVYAVLLGSGVSSSSGILTGWEIVQDLIRKLAHLKGEDCGAEPEAWYRTVFDREPDYSDLLGQVTKTSAERSQLLRGYFEPTPEELEEGKKQPSPTHRAIARLVARGYIRVILTTNFDRLLEQALADEGVQPTVISTAHAGKGALPLAHAPCTVVKVNGDYLDSRLRNTRDELSEYERPIRKLLDQIFDEYGLVVCGWSGEWDTALRAALERCSNHRFSTYWTTRRPVPDKASNLVILRRATVLTIQNADAFFTGLDDKIGALETFGAIDPVSPKVAVAQMKKYLTDDVHQIRLHDLVFAEVDRVYNAVRGKRFTADSALGEWSPERVEARLAAYESELGVLLPLMVCGAHWSTPQHYAVLLQGFQHLANRDERHSGATGWIELRGYPALILLYGMGLAALANDNYRFLRRLLELKIRQGDRSQNPAVVEINQEDVLTRDYQRALPSQKHRYTPLSDHIFGILRDPFREYILDDHSYDQAFDWLEYLLGLVYCDVQETRTTLQEKKEKNPQFCLWGPTGRFAWKGDFPTQSIMRETEAQPGKRLPRRVAEVISAGFFESGGQHADKFRDVQAAFDRTVAMVRSQWHVMP